jgi:hypothetical protein
VFYFLTSPGPQFALPIEDLNSFTVEDLIKEIKAKVEERTSAAGGGFKGL